MSYRFLGTLLAAVLLVTAAPASAQPAGSRVLVMPFDNPLREPRLHWIGEAASLLIAEELNARGVCPQSDAPNGSAPSSSSTSRSPPA
jgi:hypothetical protein